MYNYNLTKEKAIGYLKAIDKEYPYPFDEEYPLTIERLHSIPGGINPEVLLTKEEAVGFLTVLHYDAFLCPYKRIGGIKAAEYYIEVAIKKVVASKSKNFKVANLIKLVGNNNLDI